MRTLQRPRTKGANSSTRTFLSAYAPSTGSKVRPIHPFGGCLHTRPSSTGSKRVGRLCPLMTQRVCLIDSPLTNHRGTNTAGQPDSPKLVRPPRREPTPPHNNERAPHSPTGHHHRQAPHNTTHGTHNPHNGGTTAHNTSNSPPGTPTALTATVAHQHAERSSMSLTATHDQPSTAQQQTNRAELTNHHTKRYRTAGHDGSRRRIDGNNSTINDQRTTNTSNATTRTLKVNK